MPKYLISNSLQINASKETLYCKIINEIEGKTNWSKPYLKFVQVDNLPSDKIGSIRWLKIYILGRPKMLTRTVGADNPNRLDVEYISGDCIGTGSFKLDSVGDKTQVIFEWNTTTNNFLFHVIGHLLPISRIHSWLVISVLKNLDKHVSNNQHEQQS
jgi:hypothetical protein